MARPTIAQLEKQLDEFRRLAVNLHNQAVLERDLRQSVLEQLALEQKRVALLELQLHQAGLEFDARVWSLVDG